MLWCKTQMSLREGVPGSSCVCATDRASRTPTCALYFCHPGRSNAKRPSCHNAICVPSQVIAGIDASLRPQIEIHSLSQTQRSIRLT